MHWGVGGGGEEEEPIDLRRRSGQKGSKRIKLRTPDDHSLSVELRMIAAHRWQRLSSLYFYIYLEKKFSREERQDGKRIFPVLENITRYSPTSSRILKAAAVFY